MTSENTLRVENPDNTRLQHKPSRPPHILVVEDDDDVRRLAVWALIDSGFCVDAAMNGADAWESLRFNSYDLLITDYNIPSLTGVELVKKVRSARMTLPVIMATEELPMEALSQTPSLKFAAMLPKPFSSDELLETVNRVLCANVGDR